MKPVAFDYVWAASVEDALTHLRSDPGATKLIAGGQSLGPMLNLRLARPARLVDIGGLGEISQVDKGAETTFVGAGVTHAAFEDRRVADGSAGLMPHVARTIAYRAVRNRGTIGGSIAHADPAADWMLTLTALDAKVIVAGGRCRQSRPCPRRLHGRRLHDHPCRRRDGDRLRVRHALGLRPFRALQALAQVRQVR